MARTQQKGAVAGIDTATTTDNGELIPASVDSTQHRQAGNREAATESCMTVTAQSRLITSTQTFV